MLLARYRTAALRRPQVCAGRRFRRPRSGSRHLAMPKRFETAQLPDARLNQPEPVRSFQQSHLGPVSDKPVFAASGSVSECAKSFPTSHPVSASPLLTLQQLDIRCDMHRPNIPERVNPRPSHQREGGAAARAHAPAMATGDGRHFFTNLSTRQLRKSAA